jgi:diacylglycerol kinase
MVQANPQHFRRQALLISAVALVVVYLLWNIPTFDALLYPLRLFVTYVHEAGHSIMAVLTGGSIQSFTVSPDGSGLARTIGGSRFLILPAGYLGAAFFGAVLFYLTNTVRYTRSISIVIGAGLLIFTTLFARPDQSGALTALVVGWLFGIFLIGMGWFLGRLFNLLILNVLALITSLNAVLDLVYLTRDTSARNGQTLNDAAAFSQLVAPIIPPVVWAFLWAGLALLMLGISFYFSVIRPIRRGEF